MEAALQGSQSCANPDCPGACYTCLMDYNNQPYHSLLDRELGGALIDFILNGTMPEVPAESIPSYIDKLRPYIAPQWTALPQNEVAGMRFDLVVEQSGGAKIGIRVRHPSQATPNVN